MRLGEILTAIFASHFEIGIKPILVVLLSTVLPILVVV